MTLGCALLPFVVKLDRKHGLGCRLPILGTSQRLFCVCEPGCVSAPLCVHKGVTVYECVSIYRQKLRYTQFRESRHVPEDFMSMLSAQNLDLSMLSFKSDCKQHYDYMAWIL